MEVEEGKTVLSIPTLQVIVAAQQTVIKQLALGMPLHVCLATLCEMLESIMDSPHSLSSILLLEGDRLRRCASPRLPPAYCDAIDGAKIGPEVGSCGSAAFLGKLVIVSDIETDPKWSAFKGLALSHGLRACWSSPIVSSSGEVVGTFAVYYSRPMLPEQFHLDLIMQFSSLASLAIEKQHTEDAKRLAEQKEQLALNAKATFLAYMSHEIRTPLYGILGTASLLNNTRMSEDQREMLRAISSCGAGLITILNDVLDFSALESGAVKLERIPFSVQGCVQESVELYLARCLEKSISVSFQIDPGVPQYLYGDVTRVKQILMNFLSNAVKFSSEGGRVELEVIARSEDLDDYLVTFSVKDTGIGISSEGQSNLFIAFSQADPTIGRRFGGSGLGLAICDKLARAMGGSCGVVSDEGKGAVFSFVASFRKYIRDESEDVGMFLPLNMPLVEEEIQGKDFSHEILLVDDNELNLRIGKKMLESVSTSNKCDIATNGLEALQAIALKDYTLVFMDMQMPVMDGLEATQLIRSKLAGKRRPVIVALTAGAFEVDKTKCIDAGMDDYLCKPVVLSEFARVCQKYARKRDHSK